MYCLFVCFFLKTKRHAGKLKKKKMGALVYLLFRSFEGRVFGNGLKNGDYNVLFVFCLFED